MSFDAGGETVDNNYCQTGKPCAHRNALLDSPISLEPSGEAKRLRNFSFPSPTSDANDWSFFHAKRTNVRTPNSAERSWEYSQVLGEGAAASGRKDSQESNGAYSRSEALFDKLRRYSFNRDSRSSNEDFGIFDMFKVSLNDKKRKSGENSPRKPLMVSERRDSVLSSVSLGSKDTERSLNTKRPHHRRTSAMSLDKTSQTAAYPKHPVARNVEPSHDQQIMHQEQKLRLGVNRGRSLGHSEPVSPHLTIENTNEQIRRNSDGYFQSMAFLKTRRGTNNAGPVFAGFPETGDVSPSIIDLDTIEFQTPYGDTKKGYSLYSSSLSPSSKKWESRSTGLGLMTFESVEERAESLSRSTENISNKDADVLKSDDDEILSLKEFLRTY